MGIFGHDRARFLTFTAITMDSNDDDILIPGITKINIHLLDNQLKFPALIVCKRSLPTSKDGESDKV
jgi:hypothetical protein